MPNIPYTSRIDARSARSNAPELSAEAFGAGVGRAMQDLGRTAMNASAVLNRADQEREDRLRKERLAEELAKNDFTMTELEFRNSTDADATDYQQQLATRYDDWVAETSANIDDDKVRGDYRVMMLQRKDELMRRSAEYQVKTQAENSTLRANSSLQSLQNRVTAMPTTYDTALEDGNVVIDSLPVPATAREGMKQQWLYDTTAKRFDGMLRGASTPEEYDAIAKELTDENTGWADKMLPRDYEDTLKRIDAAKKAERTKLSAEATAQLKDIDERNKDPLSLIPDEQMREAQLAVSRAGDPALQKRMARAVRDQKIIKDNRRLPPAELRARINAMRGNPGAAYPGITPELSEAMARAQDTFGVNVSYLGATIMREYGGELSKKAPKLDEKFKPLIMGQGFDARNVRSEVMQAATVAGQLFGSPVGVTAAAGSSGLDVSTEGMAPADKARLAGAMVDAGFTGVSEYEGYMRFDMRSAVPQTFGQDKNGAFWGGYTALSAEVVDQLKQRGFAAGVTSRSLKRDTSAITTEVDYGKPTSVLNAQGLPASSAVGVMQFTKDTFKNVMRTPGVAEAMGLDLKDMSDDDLLELRKDPNIAIMAGAALAAQNQKALTTALGRPASDAELYMAHFLGASGAAAFIARAKAEPQSPAADIMPSVAENHKSVFFDGTRKKSMQEVYDSISMQFDLSPAQITFDDTGVMQNILKTAESELKRDPIAYASATGSVVVPGLFDNENGFEARGRIAQSVAEYYSIPSSDMKPFTEDEAAYIKRQLDAGDADAQLDIMSSIQSMGRDTAKSAMKQLEQKDAVFAHAGDMFIDGMGAQAAEVIRGRIMIRDNPEVLAQASADERTVNDAFLRATKGALLGIPPARRQVIQSAALAHWAATYMPRKGLTPFNAEDFKNSVNAVLGGGENNPAIDDVNGQLTFLPQGVDATTVERALKRMTLQDYTKLSADGQPPRYADGTLIDPEDIADEVMLVSIGGGKYQMKLDNGEVLSTGEQQGARAKAYIFQPTARDLFRLADAPVSGRAVSPSSTPSATTERWGTR